MLVIAGNHDHPERIKASTLLAEQLGITVLGLPKGQANGGMRRPVYSLSGGETFLTSLALAPDGLGSKLKMETV